jgi:transposase-like protein
VSVDFFVKPNAEKMPITVTIEVIKRLLKLIYLAHKNIKKKWTMPLANWGTTAQKLAIWFPGRMVLDLQ